MKPIRMVIFDKDGTLMDFDAFWVTVSRLAVPEMLAELKVDPALAETLYEAMGIRDGITDVRGVLCWGTYEQMGEEMHRALTDAGVVCDREEVVRLTKLLYHRHAPEGEIRPPIKKHCKAIIPLLKNKRERIRTSNPRLMGQIAAEPNE